jgi:hypothetical protein
MNLVQADLGASAATKRPTSVVLVSVKGKEFEASDKLADVLTKVKSVTPIY